MKVIDLSQTRTKEKILAGALNPLRLLLPNRLIEDCSRKLEHRWRERCWGPVVTILACVWKELASASARDVEDWVASLHSDPEAHDRDGSDFCAARKRLPLNVFKDALRHVGQAAAATGLRMFDLQVWLLDGTTLRTANTPANAKYFGRSRNSIRASRSPILRMVLLVCAGCGAVLDVAMGSYVTSELELFGQILACLPAGGLLIADSGYSAFMVLALVQLRGSQVLTRRHSRRRRHCIKRLGKGDELHRWTRPLPGRITRWNDRLNDCPANLTVRAISRTVERRGYRSWKLHMITTLTDPVKYPAENLVTLYLQRWNVELNLRTLKTDYCMAHLHSKTPDIVLKEICSIVLAYNCVVATQACGGLTPHRHSHMRTRKLILSYSERMVTAPTIRLPHLHKEMLELIRTARLKEQIRLPQPRAIVQRKSTYPMLMTTRQKWRRKYNAA